MITYCFYVIIYSYFPPSTFPLASKPCPLNTFLVLLERDFRKLKNGCASLIMTKKQYAIIRLLGPMLFSIYINDCTTYLCNLLTLYADDCKLIGPAETEEERACILLDLDRLSSWSSTWALQFNATKCKVLHLGHNNPHHPYHIGCDQLEAVAKERDLGVIVDKDLKFHSHTQAQVAKANQALRIIKCSFVTKKSCVVIKLYKSLVCPHLELGLTLAFPKNKMDTRALESVQREQPNWSVA